MPVKCRLGLDEIRFRSRFDLETPCRGFNQAYAEEVC